MTYYLELGSVTRCSSLTTCQEWMLTTLEGWLVATVYSVGILRMSGWPNQPNERRVPSILEPSCLEHAGFWFEPSGARPDIS